MRHADMIAFQDLDFTGIRTRGMAMSPRSSGNNSRDAGLITSCFGETLDLHTTLRDSEFVQNIDGVLARF